MTTKEIVENYYSAIISGRYQDALTLKSPAATYWICGEGSWPFGGVQNEHGMEKILQQIGARFPKGIRLDINSIIADGDNAAVYLENYGERIDGRIYANKVVVLNIVQDGQITGQFEYLDTILANELLCGELDSK